MKRGVWRRGLSVFWPLPVIAAVRDVVDSHRVTADTIRYHAHPAYPHVDFNTPPTDRIARLDRAPRARSLSVYLPKAVLAETAKDPPTLLQRPIEKTFQFSDVLK